MLQKLLLLMDNYVYIQVFNKLIRRYKYLEKTFEEEIKKVTIISDVSYCRGCCFANGKMHHCRTNHHDTNVDFIFMVLLWTKKA